MWGPTVLTTGGFDSTEPENVLHDMTVRSQKTPIGIGPLFMVLRWIVTALTGF